MAQYAGNANYTLFQDEFDVLGRTWSKNTYTESSGKWRAYFKGESVTHGAAERQAYQRSQCLFDTNDNMMLLVSDYVSHTDLDCNDIEIPSYEGCKIDTSYHIRYFSGALQSITPSFLYGYFEIRCKMPVHRGAFPAFWLYNSKNSGSDPFYEEIDIFEYSWGIASESQNPDSHGDGDSRCYTMGMYYSNVGHPGVLTQCSVAKIYSRVSDYSPSMNDWNTFGCLWMPDKVEWYLNGQMVNSYYNVDSIPHHPLYIMVNYAIDSYSMSKNNQIVYYTGTDTMYIDYIRAYRPIWDCGTSVLIEEQSDLDNYEHGIKSSVTINPNDPIIVDYTDKIDIMSSGTVTINAPFIVEAGSRFSVAIQQCPE